MKTYYFVYVHDGEETPTVFSFTTDWCEDAVLSRMFAELYTSDWCHGDNIWSFFDNKEDYLEKRGDIVDGEVSWPEPIILESRPEVVY